jgi:hypothetical protein
MWAIIEYTKIKKPYKQLFSLDLSLDYPSTT